MPKILCLADVGPEKRVVRAAKKSSNEAEIIIYDFIGEDPWFGGGFSAKKIDTLLKEIGEVKSLTVRINSGGGSVFDGMTIYNRLQEYKKKNKATLKVHIDGVAASIASIIALAGDEVIMGDGAFYMIHLPWTYSQGDRNELDRSINLLMEIEEQMISIYQRKTGLSRVEIRDMLEKETWMSAELALEKKFADSKVEETMPIAASLMASKWFNKAPREYFSAEAIAKQEAAEKKNNLIKNLDSRIARK